MSPKRPQRKVIQREVTLFRRARLVYAGLLAVLFLIGAVLRIQHVNDVRNRTPDEQYYTDLAEDLLDHGITAGQPAAKLAYVSALATTFKVSGIHDARAGAWLSCAASIASLAAVGVIGMRFLPPSAALFAMFAMGLSTLDRVVARRCWQEAIVEFMALVLVWSACELVRDGRRRWPYVLLLICGSGAVLMKQIACLAVSAVMLYVAAHFARRRDWRPFALVSATASMSAAVAISALALFGGGGRIWNIWNSYVTASIAEEWGTTYQSAPWYVFLGALPTLAPVISVLAAITLCMSFLKPDLLRWLGLQFLSEEVSLMRLFSWVTAVGVLGVSLLPMTQNFRYLAPVVGVCCLCASMAPQAVVYAAGRYVPRFQYPIIAVVAMATLAAARADHRTFEQVFVKADMQDLAIGFVQMTPYITSGWYDAPSSETSGNARRARANFRSARGGYGPIAGVVDAAGDQTGRSTVHEEGTLYVEGWAADPESGAPVESVTVFVDRSERGKAVLGLPRSDVAKAFTRQEFLNSGWRFEMPAAGLSGGRHVVTAIASGPSGTAELPAPRLVSVVRAAPAVVGVIDNASAAHDESAGATVCANGWAADMARGAPVDAVTVLVDGRPIGKATLGGGRPDVAAALNRPNFADSGWSFCSGTQTFDAGTHRVTAIAASRSAASELRSPRVITIHPDQ